MVSENIIKNINIVGAYEENGDLLEVGVRYKGERAIGLYSGKSKTITNLKKQLNSAIEVIEELKQEVETLKIRNDLLAGSLEKK